MPGVETKHKTYEVLTPKWERCRDTSLGTDEVKARGTRYLPALDSHQRKPEKYSEYILRALYYNAVGRTIDGLAGAIFQKAPSITVPDVATVEEDIKDITLNGQPLEMFALGATREYLTTGRYGILVDMASEEAVTQRPYWVGYRAEDIVNWRFEKMGGDQELSLVVLREFVDEPDPNDQFVVKPQIQYRVLRLSTEGIYTQQVYKEKLGSDGEPRLQKEYVGGEVLTPVRRGEPLNFIPFSLPWIVPNPPLLDLVDINLSHYRGSADLKHGLHYTALPTPWVAGHNDTSKPLAIGSGTAWSLEKDGKAGMLEFTGQGLGAIREDLQEMQRQMATLGARLLEEAPRYAETALSVSMRHASDYATLRTIAQVVEQQLTFSLQIHCWWVGTESLVADVEADIELNKVFYDQSVSADELRALLLALQANTISFKTFYARLKNTGWTREGVTHEEELEEIEKQPPIIGVTAEQRAATEEAGQRKEIDEDKLRTKEDKQTIKPPKVVN